MRTHLVVAVLAPALAVGLSVTFRNPANLAAAANADVISGVVSSASGPEAGVWVIAETDDLQTKFRKIVVTDDAGRFVLPEMPQAQFNIWVRGYGLVDSKPVSVTPGRDLTLTAYVARTPQEAAQVYPASYWVSLLELPDTSDFRATDGVNRVVNGINPELQTQAAWVNNLKGCQRCHQLGTKVTREIPDQEAFGSSAAAWDHRVHRGQRGTTMNSFMTNFGRQRGLRMFADWTDRIAAGEVPEAPPRPAGVERNVVITMWSWADNVAFVHDEIATDRRNPRVNANGPVYGLDYGNDYMMITDPVRHSSTRLKIPVRADPATMGGFPADGFQPYRNFGMKPVWNNPAGPHNPMIGSDGRVWMTTTIRGPDNPAWCKPGSDNRYAQYFPLSRSGKNSGYFDPKTQQFVLVDTCFGTHHLQFAEDDDNTLYFGVPGGPVIGWLNTNLYDKTRDERVSQGWCPTVLDTNGDGRITKPWNEPASGTRPAKFDPKLDTRVVVSAYGLIVNPVDDAVWAAADEFPGHIVRLVPGDNPPESCISERYELPVELGYRPRGLDVDRNGVLWTALAGNSRFASFDRRKCKVLNGPSTYSGQHCKEGWSFYPMPGPSYKGTNIGADFHYYNWVDQFNTLGLGENIPIANGSGSDALLALNPATRTWVVMRVPYPQGFHSRGMDGRIDDPNGGWKGRGIYATYGADASWHVETGVAERGNLVRFQIRPHALAN